MKNVSPEPLPVESVSESLPLKRTSRGLSGLRGRETQPEKGSDIWLYTLSDLLLLLVIFFVLLFGMTLSRQEEKSQPLQASMATAREREETLVVIPPEERQTPNQPSQEIARALEADLAETLNDENRHEGVAIEKRADSLILTFPEPIVFDPGQAQLRPLAGPILTKVASFILNHPEVSVEVQGHTDNRPINNRRYPSNWELSVDRATQVAKALIDLGVDPAHLSVKGFGEYRALYPNDTGANQLKNRRVEIQFSLAPQS